ncbi:MAG: bacillithiol system redox-active protein YtxJ [Balneolaceae bacterium]
MRSSSANKIQTLVQAPDSPWNELTSTDDVVAILQRSEERIQLIYKHSETCGVCLISKEELEKVVDEIAPTADLHVVNVIVQRPVSLAIAHELDVRHESPQVILLKGGKVLWSGSHWDVTAGNVRAALGRSFP